MPFDAILIISILKGFYMNTFQVAYIPVGAPTFHRESMQAAFTASAALLRETAKKIEQQGFNSGNDREHGSSHIEIAVPDGILLSPDDVRVFADVVHPQLIIFQNVAFANAAYVSEILHAFDDVPILLWTLREPVIDGTRLRLNSLTGAFSAANAIRQCRQEPFEYIYGAPDEEKVRSEIFAAFRAAKLKADMRTLRMAAIGHTPEGFGFGRSLDLDLLDTFGVRLLSIEARELIDKAKSYTEEDIRPYLDDAAARTKGLEQTPEKNRLDFARLYRAYDEFVRDNHIGALASRCWPDFFTAFGTPVCAVLAMLNDLDIPSSCEADTYGALSMYAGAQLSGKPAFFGDPVSLDEKENTITFWHCGTAACSLARTDTGAAIGEHCNRHIGPTMEFGTKAAPEATIFRIGRNPDGTFRFFVASGEALDRPKQFYGTSTVIRTEASADRIIRQAVQEGWEPHYAVIYQNCAEELTILGHMLNIPVERF